MALGGDGGPGWDGGGGGRDRWRRVVGRVFGDAENPLGWAIRIGRVRGIRVRVHLLFVVFAVAQMLWSLPRDEMGPVYQGLIVGWLFVLVLAHEFGHCFACRWVGGTADDILMWPLGGLASCDPPRSWRAHLVTAAGGPAVNLVLVPVFAGALWWVGESGAIVFNPIRPEIVVGGAGSYWTAGLVIGHAVNTVLLLFNVLCPMYPLDGGRMVQSVMWAKLGERRSMEVAVVVGFVTAGALGVVGLVVNEAMLLGIAVFGGLVCYDEKRKLGAAEALGGAEYALAMSRAEAAREARELEASERAAAGAARLAAEEDRVLEKIASEGMGALTKAEKKVLEEATRRRRGE